MGEGEGKGREISKYKKKGVETKSNTKQIKCDLAQITIPHLTTIPTRMTVGLIPLFFYYFIFLLLYFIKNNKQYI